MGWMLTLCVVLAAGAATGSYLLPGDITPSAYIVQYVFDIDPDTNFSYFGVVTINMTVLNSTSSIVLHAQGYNISEDAITLTGTNAPTVTEVTLNDTYNFLTLTLSEQLEESNYTLTIPFYGNLPLDLEGAYISSYTDSDTNVQEYLVATHFEAISARKAFPCFDEPSYKATFQLTIGHHANYTAFSNMPLAENSSTENVFEDIWSSEKIGTAFNKSISKFLWDKFETSVPMSTYLVAFIVAKFNYLASATELANVEFRILAREDAMDQAVYAADIGPKILTYYEEFFNISYPLPKMDLAALPDFSQGAMENWGLDTFRETMLLFDENSASIVDKQVIAETIAHELAHQWFGNLVTMKWWSDLWLNEGFATYMAAVGTDFVEPTWEEPNIAAVNNMLIVFDYDSLESSHPVSVELDDPKRINEIFDAISYQKGAVLIRMIALLLGDDVFKKALNVYLGNHAYGNADHDDLWSAFTEVSNENGGLTGNVSVKTVMDNWTTQTGFPLLNITRDYSSNTFTVTQKRYLSAGANVSTTVSWWVPLSIMSPSANGTVQWLSDEQGVNSSYQFEYEASADEWILFNYDMMVPCRVNYDETNWQLISNTLSSNYTNIPLLGRVQILSDAFALAWSGQLDYNTTLTIASYLEQETEYLPLQVAIRYLTDIEVMIKRSSSNGVYQKFMKKLVKNQYEQSGGLPTVANADDDFKTVNMQILTSSYACREELAECTDTAVELYKSWMNTEDPDTTNPIPLDHHYLVYCTAIRHGSINEWEFALARMQKSNSAIEIQNLMLAMTCSRDVWVLTQYLEWAISGSSVVRLQDADTVIALIAGSSPGYNVAKNFLYTHIEEIYNAFDSQSSRLGYIVTTLLSQFTTQLELDEFESWYETNNKYFEDAELTVTQAIESAKLNIAWVTKNKDTIVETLKKFTT